VKSLYVIGPGGSGKTALCVGMALKLKDEGLKVGYFKPVGSVPPFSREVDGDAVLMKEVCDSPHSAKDLVQFTMFPGYLTRYKRQDYDRKVREAYGRLAADVDTLLIGGAPNPAHGAALGIDAFSIGKALDVPLVIVSRVENDNSVDQAIISCQLAGHHGLQVAGVVFNNVPRTLLDKTKGVFEPILEERGIELIGIIPRRVEIAAPTAREFYEVLGGELLAGDEHLDLLIEDVLVGAMTMDGAVNYLRRSANKAVVTGGDRADIALAALETNTSVLVLTGGSYPSIKVITRAEEKGVPVILVNYDTYTAIERLHEVSRHISPGDHRSMELARDNIDKFCDWDRLRGLLVD